MLNKGLLLSPAKLEHEASVIRVSLTLKRERKTEAEARPEAAHHPFRQPPKILVTDHSTSPQPEHLYGTVH
jgi:hypothetical protein